MTKDTYSMILRACNRNPVITEILKLFPAK